ncbi:cytochrome c biogenesis protein CcdA [Clostridium sp. D2Q-14]|uniref:cytochrome c biogenesis CcdA family protein n=1 Tax=Anaeromonas gelatinilytica TaxID=2683194 RepID=UPI00193B0405|nr:cytochrome c biogenesis protein CcdA [Anaeromonas gelatinilytica]MBS4535154.1 cytochrome c biogenesis protein CcdA [Anaeromonas gelatinilytica]
MFEEVTFTMAFGAGVLSFFSPCILPLIPAYIMYMTGTSMEEELSRKKWLAVSRTLGFVVGFTIIFMMMGLSASYVGRVFIQNKAIFTKISGVLIMFFGLNLMGIIEIGFMNKEKKAKASKKVTSVLGSTIMGMAFAAGWTPCYGPILASILVRAGFSNNITQAVYLLLVYSLGMAIPFILTALFISHFSKYLNRVQKWSGYIYKIAGLILVIFGILVFLDKIVIIGNWLN